MKLRELMFSDKVGINNVIVFTYYRPSKLLTTILIERI